MTARRLLVISAGLSVPSSTRLLADRLAAATGGALQERGIDITTRVVELREHAHEITDHLLTGFPSGGLVEVMDELRRADGLVVVTPVFNASTSGLFKSFFDVVEDGALAGKPVLVAATGGSARHSLVLDHALRPLLGYLRAVVVPTGVYAATEDWGSGDAASALAARVDRAGEELAALVASRPPVAVGDADEPTPFAELLAGLR